jgi:hypothetical protein
MCSCPSASECVAAIAPEILSGNDGEEHFIRADLAMSATEARGRALLDGQNLSGYAVDVVEMLPVPEHFRETFGWEWAVVPAGTPDAVTYWRFSV